MANQFLGLGLFIMLLSFFIVLSSMSSFEDSKSQAVIESLNETFLYNSNGKKEYIAQTDPIAESQKSFRQGDSLEDISQKLRSSIPDAKTRKNRFGNQMIVKIPRAKFDAALQVTDEASSERLSKMIVGMLSIKKGAPYQMDIILETAENLYTLQKQDPVKAKALMKDVAEYGRKFEEEGLNKKRLTVGITKGVEDTIALIFRQSVPTKMEAVK